MPHEHFFKTRRKASRHFGVEDGLFPLPLAQCRACQCVGQQRSRREPSVLNEVRNILAWPNNKRTTVGLLHGVTIDIYRRTTLQIFEVHLGCPTLLSLALRVNHAIQRNLELCIPLAPHSLSCSDYSPPSSSGGRGAVNLSPHSLSSSSSGGWGQAHVTP